MKKSVFRLCAGLLAVALLSVAVVPCYAESDKYTSTGTFWQAVADKWYFNGTVIPAIIGTVSDKVCSESGDKKHHGSLKSYEQNPDKSYTAICDFCSAEFPVYDADLSAAYNDYVQTLPATGYTSNNSLRWSPSHLYSEVSYNSGTIYHSRCAHKGGQASGTISSRFSYSYDCANNFIRLTPLSGSRTFPYVGSMIYFGGSAPVDGFYSIVSGVPSVSGCYVDSDGVNHPVSGNWNVSASSTYYSAGDTVSISLRSGFHNISEIPASISCQLVAYQGIPPIYEIVPVASFSADTYNINTRPTSITGGNYGIVGDNGQITKVEDNSTIVNETNNTYYNPATGITAPITDWSYDYSDRSYRVTLGSGDTSTVTYGDESISIVETTVNESGDTITNNYTIYYLVEGSGSGEVCDHAWTETSTTPATCTLAGSKLLTCSKCQQTRKELIPALGHDWQVKQTVTTQYDEDGNLTQQGYTIFECSRCHEQYKSPDGTIPPGGGSGADPGGEEGETIWDKLGNLLGTIGKGILGMIEAVLGKLLDALIALAEMLMEKLKTVVETILSIFDELPAIFGGFLALLTALFPFLPPELMTILTFGVIAVVFIGIIKAVRG